MSIGKSQFIGAAGQYYVAYGLSVREICASITVGNSPGVDILVSKDGGLKNVSIQVKTSRNAYRKKVYGREGYEWDVGKSVVGKQSPKFWYAFVNLQSEDDLKWNPEVFFVPSKWVAEFVKSDWTRYLYYLPISAKELCYEKWDNIKRCLDDDQEVFEYSQSWPEDLLVRWGE